MKNRKQRKWKKIKIGFLITIAFIVTCIIYWPLYKNVNLPDYQVYGNEKMDSEIKVLELPINKEYIAFFAHIPTIKHRIYFENNNKVYLIHADSKDYPYVYSTGDISQEEKAKKEKIGAMTIYMHYGDGLGDDLFYRNIEEGYSQLLDDSKLYKLASSTLVFKKMDSAIIEQLSFQDGTSVQMTRPVGRSYISTRDSKAIITIQWRYFFLSFLVLSILLLKRELIDLFRIIGKNLKHIFEKYKKR
ncbi:hypothetical protein KJ885_05840 [Patescibacteria group bacterium]|nr:hypothetical protein [Patescibacteria group bacterium]